jgi:hypothetical protein
MNLISMTYGAGFVPTPAPSMRDRVSRLQVELSKLPQYEPETKHYFHGGMYCREVWRKKDVLVVGKVHKKEHFYLIVSGTVAITTDGGTELITGPKLIKSSVGTKRAVHAVTDALCMTFHVVDAQTIDEAELELVEPDAADMYIAGNRLQHHSQEVLP